MEHAQFSVVAVKNQLSWEFFGERVNLYTNTFVISPIFEGDCMMLRISAFRNESVFIIITNQLVVCVSGRSCVAVGQLMRTLVGGCYLWCAVILL